MRVVQEVYMFSVPIAFKILEVLCRHLSACFFFYSVFRYFRQTYIYSRYQIYKKSMQQFVACFLAGAEGIEPSAYGFGDRRSTN